MNPLLGRGFTWNIKPSFLRKIKVKKLKCCLLQFLFSAFRVKYCDTWKCLICHLPQIKNIFSGVPKFRHITVVCSQLLGVRCLHFVTMRILTVLHSERPKLRTILAFLSAIGFKWIWIIQNLQYQSLNYQDSTVQSTLDNSKLKFILNYWYLKVKFSDPRKFTLRYQ